MSEYKFETLQLHVGQEHADPATDSRAVPIYATTSYVFHSAQHAADRFSLADSGNIYGRLTNSTQGVLEDRIAALESGTAGLAVASGAAAIAYTVQALAKAGEHIVAQNTIYGGSANLLAHTLPLYGIKSTFVNIHDLSQVNAAILPETKAIYIETLGNPNSDIPDIDALAAIAHAHSIPLVIDNTFGTPYLIRPIEHGADVVVHSATKFIGGHGTTLGGVIVDAGTFDWSAGGKYPWLSEPNPSYHGIRFTEAAGNAAFVTYIRAILLRDTGACISPFAAFLLLQGVETLSLRLERHAENTKKVVEYLNNHPKVENVRHPSLPDHPDHALYEKYFPNGGASIFTFDIKGGQEDAFRFIDSLRLFSLLANVADVKSLVIHPATTTHSQLTDYELEEAGIHRNTVRLSIGTEHIDDIIADLEKGFSAV
ncbi:MAG: O-acetylhomoserine aminocarboxypropyltransferase/cysteine synthase [Oscillospiraceae bacterium]|nr:O-acetylhomoserine aminocarboxypropyltransferase/cysteine synthase [Oscillospiraceae bacterium]